MRLSKLLAKNNIAVSEVIGGMLLLAIAVVVGVTIYANMLPVPGPDPEANVQIVGYVNDEGQVIIEHIGGESLPAYEVYVDGYLYYTHYDKSNPWEIGETPEINDIFLSEENDNVNVAVYMVYDEGNKQAVFEGDLKFKRQEEQGPQIMDPMSISTLRTRSTDEDLICYNYSIDPNINANTFIYNWLINKGSGFVPLLNIHLPFNTNNSYIIKDYSGNHFNGTASWATWTEEGKIGGAYSFSGNDFISIPYCFENSYLDTFSVQSWIKTNQDSGTIISYDREKYWELAVSDGVVKWSTNASSGTVDLEGDIIVNDNNWHLITATYDSTIGYAKIFVDGLLDKSQKVHNNGEELGNGENPIGYIAKGTGGASTQTIFSTSFENQNEKDNWQEHNISVEEQETWDNIMFDNFEGFSWGDWNDGGDDCYSYSGSTFAHSGNSAIHLRDNSWRDWDWDSATYSDSIYADTADYTQMSIDFWWITDSFENWEDFYVGYYDGYNVYWLDNFVVGPGHYSNGVFYHSVCYINESDYSFTDYARFVIRCDASGDWDHLYIDDIYVNTSTESRLEYDFDLRDSNDLNPKSGSYSIGGSGDIDPEFGLFNRSAIDISNFEDVKLSVWYSYKDTESSDFFGLYYKNGDSWSPIFEIDEPQIGSGQVDWTYVESEIPNELDSLVLQFKWMTSSSSEFVAIDDLTITGVPYSGETNFTGIIDEVKIYNRVISEEQIYQNYLLDSDGQTNRSVIVSEETEIGDFWKCVVTPNDGFIDDIPTESNILEVISYPGGDD